MELAIIVEAHPSFAVELFSTAKVHNNPRTPLIQSSGIISLFAEKAELRLSAEEFLRLVQPNLKFGCRGYKDLQCAKQLKTYDLDLQQSPFPSIILPRTIQVILCSCHYLCSYWILMDIVYLLP